MLILIIAESALETIPPSIWNTPIIQKYAMKKRMKPPQLILDRSYHHSAMKKLKNSEKRGRPDIVHFTLLEALGSPLNKEGLLQTYVHTIDDHVMIVDPNVRLPRNYNRFIGLMEQLFELGKIPPTEKPLVKLKEQTVTQLLTELKPTHTVAFTRLGKFKQLDATIAELAKEKKPAAIIGGFPRGHFSGNLLKLVDETVCFDPEMLETWVTTSRVIYEYEKALELPTKRLRKVSYQSTT
jgi:rRNA small subunit pseudouridine methyltransferase Nep1